MRLNERNKLSGAEFKQYYRHNSIFVLRVIFAVLWEYKGRLDFSAFETPLTQQSLSQWAPAKQHCSGRDSC